MIYLLFYVCVLADCVQLYEKYIDIAQFWQPYNFREPYLATRVVDPYYTENTFFFQNVLNICLDFLSIWLKYISHKSHRAEKLRAVFSMFKNQKSNF